MSSHFLKILELELEQKDNVEGGAIFEKKLDTCHVVVLGILFQFFYNFYKRFFKTCVKGERLP